MFPGTKPCPGIAGLTNPACGLVFPSPALIGQLFDIERPVCAVAHGRRYQPWEYHQFRQVPVVVANCRYTSLYFPRNFAGKGCGEVETGLPALPSRRLGQNYHFSISALPQLPDHSHRHMHRHSHPLVSLSLKIGGSYYLYISMYIYYIQYFENQGNLHRFPILPRAGKSMGSPGKSGKDDLHPGSRPHRQATLHRLHATTRICPDRTCTRWSASAPRPCRALLRQAGIYHVPARVPVHDSMYRPVREPGRLLEHRDRKPGPAHPHDGVEENCLALRELRLLPVFCRMGCVPEFLYSLMSVYPNSVLSQNNSLFLESVFLSSTV